MAIDHAHFMRIALEEAARGKAEGNSAVGSVVVDGDTVVARGRNLVLSTYDPTAHAETVALREASVALRQVEFPGYRLYTTFEPCPMCCGAILASRIATLVMGARHVLGESRWGGYTLEKLLDMTQSRGTIEVVTGILVQECSDIRYT